MNPDFKIVREYMNAHFELFRGSEDAGFKNKLDDALELFERIQFSSSKHHKPMRRELENHFQELLEKASMLVFKTGQLGRLFRAVDNPVALSSGLSKGLNSDNSPYERGMLPYLKEILSLGAVTDARSFAVKDGLNKKLNAKFDSEMTIKLYENIKASIDLINLNDIYYEENSTHPLSIFMLRLIRHMLEQKQYATVAKWVVEDADYLKTFAGGVSGGGHYAFVMNLGFGHIWSHDMLNEVHARYPEQYHVMMQELAPVIVLHMGMAAPKRLALEKLPFTPAFDVSFCRDACKNGILGSYLRPAEYKALNRWSKAQGGQDLAVQMSKIKEIKKAVSRYQQLVNKTLPTLRQDSNAVTSDAFILDQDSLKLMVGNPIILESLFIPADKRFSASHERMIDVFRTICHATKGRWSSLREFISKNTETVFSREGVAVMEAFMLGVQNSVRNSDSQGAVIVDTLISMVKNPSRHTYLQGMSFEGYEMLKDIVPYQMQDKLRSVKWESPRIRREILASDMAL